MGQTERTTFLTVGVWKRSEEDVLEQFELSTEFQLHELY
jgi:hypothetical protein